MRLSAILAFLATLASKSVGGIAAFLAGAIVILLADRKTRKFGLAAMGIGAVAALGLGITVFTTELHPSTVNDTLAGSKKWSGMVRTVIWKESLQLIADHPILGTGLRSYQTEIAPYHTATWMETFPHPHNLFLMLWIETGLLGLLSFGWILLTLVRGLRLKAESSKQEAGSVSVPSALRLQLFAPMVAILVAGIIDVPYFRNDLAVQFWMLVAISMRHAEDPSFDSRSQARLASLGKGGSSTQQPSLPSSGEVAERHARPKGSSVSSS